MLTLWRSMMLSLSSFNFLLLYSLSEEKVVICSWGRRNEESGQNAPGRGVEKVVIRSWGRRNEERV